MAPSKNVEVENTVKFGVIRRSGRENKPIQREFGMEAYAVGL